MFSIDKDGNKYWDPYNWDIRIGNCFHEFLELDQIINSLERMLSALYKQGSNPQIILTISPIPLKGMLATELNGKRLIQSPLELDFMSKSFLRLAIKKVLDKPQSSRIHYFPSLEIIRWLGPCFKNNDYR